jgi:hypothetical protein
MSGFRHRGDSSRDVTVGFAWWRSNRARMADLAEAEAEQAKALRWQWREACTGTSLSRMIYTPSGVTIAIPRIGHVDLGPPISFTVQMRPWQTLAQFEDAVPRIASAMNVPSLSVNPLVSNWLRITISPD